MYHIRLKQWKVKQSYTVLNRQGKEFLFCEIGNKRGFLIGPPSILTQIETQGMLNATVIETVEYKLHEQHMRMMMGKTGTTKESLSTYRCRVLNEPYYPNPYFVWEILK